MIFSKNGQKNLCSIGRPQKSPVVSALCDSHSFFMVFTFIKLAKSKLLRFICENLFLECSSNVLECHLEHYESSNRYECSTDLGSTHVS